MIYFSFGKKHSPADPVFFWLIGTRSRLAFVVLMIEIQTLFSKKEFIHTWVENSNLRERMMTIPFGNGSDGCQMHGIAKIENGKAEFGPHGLFAGPARLTLQGRELYSHLIKELKKQGIARMLWHVRFDHGALALRLQEAGFRWKPYWTHTISLAKPYEEIFSNYNATRRNQIRKSHRRGLQIRHADSYNDIAAYWEVHEKLASQKSEFELKYSFQLISALYELADHTILLIAEVNDRVVAGALFFVDGDSMFYWHGASDRNYKQYFPTGALLDHAVKIAIGKGFRTFNLGGSNSDSLRRYKSSFGAENRQNRTFYVEAKRTLPTKAAAKAKNLLSRVWNRAAVARAIFSGNSLILTCMESLGTPIGLAIEVI